jgi:stage IV sporulation protein FB
VAFSVAFWSLGPVLLARLIGLLFVFFVCVVLHEYGHALAARVYGVQTRDIIVTPLGGIARMERMPESPVAEIIIALAGPAVNVVICAVLMTVLLLAGAHADEAAVKQFRIVSWADFGWMLWGCNVGMAIFNMLPAFPSDGGRVLRAMLTLFVGRLPATQVAVGLGAVVAVGLGILGIIGGAPQLPFIALLFAFIGQMELMMVRRQEMMRGRPYAQSAFLSPEQAALYEPPEPDFTGYAWDSRSAAWIEWRGGVAVRKCRMRVD